MKYNRYDLKEDYYQSKSQQKTHEKLAQLEQSYTITFNNIENYYVRQKAEAEYFAKRNKIAKKQFRRDEREFHRYLKKQKRNLAPYCATTELKIFALMILRKYEYYFHGFCVYTEDDDNSRVETLKQAVNMLKFALDEENFTFKDVQEYASLGIKNIRNFERPYPKHTAEEYKVKFKEQIDAIKTALDFCAEHINVWAD